MSDSVKYCDILGNELSVGDYVLYANSARDCSLRAGRIISSNNSLHPLLLKMRGSHRFIYSNYVNNVVKITEEQYNKLK